MNHIINLSSAYKLDCGRERELEFGRLAGRLLQWSSDRYPERPGLGGVGLEWAVERRDVRE